MLKIDSDILKLKQEKNELEALERLSNNSDFKLAIQSAYINKHAHDLVLSKGKLGISPQTQEDINRQLDSVALFAAYLDSRIMRLSTIDHDINEAEQLRIQVLTGKEND